MAQVATAEFWYNSAHHASLNCSTFKALYGREPNLGGLPHLSAALPSDIASGELDWTAHTDLLRLELARAQDRFKETSGSIARRTSLRRRRASPSQTATICSILCRQSPLQEARLQVLRPLPGDRTHWHAGVSTTTSPRQQHSSGIPRLSIEAVHSRLYPGVL